MATPTNLPAAYTQGQTNTAALMNSIRGAFRILQVAQGTSTTQVATASTTYADVGLSVALTPQDTNSKVFVIVYLNWYETFTQKLQFNIVRGSTQVTETVAMGGDANNLGGTAMMTVLDSPSTTSSTTYKVQFRQSIASGAGYMIANSTIINRITAFEVSA